MTELFDTHFHVYEDDDLSRLLANARQAGVGWLTAVASDLSDAAYLVREAERHLDSRLFTTVGVHPHQARDYSENSREEVSKLVSATSVKAIGEIGLDYHYEYSDIESQQKVFTDFLNFAVEFGLPAIIHCREAYEDCFRILKETGAGERARILLHSYTGDPEWVERFSQEFDAWFSFNGIVTFKKADNVRGSLATVPDERLLLETDSPYLAPIPNRGKRNQPAWLAYTAEAVARARGTSVEELASLTTLNGRVFFGV